MVILLQYWNYTVIQHNFQYCYKAGFGTSTVVEISTTVVWIFSVIHKISHIIYDIVLLNWVLYPYFVY